VLVVVGVELDYALELILRALLARVNDLTDPPLERLPFRQKWSVRRTAHAESTDKPSPPQTIQKRPTMGFIETGVVSSSEEEPSVVHERPASTCLLSSSWYTG
jgi:hypothetical protein